MMEWIEISLYTVNQSITGMTFEQSIAKFFKMDDSTWRRHSNPWSVITRNTVLPALIIAFWSRFWLGWWSVIPIVLSLLWAWFNPRMFSAPRSYDHWTSKSVLGERVWLNRKTIPVPRHHQKVPNYLSFLSGLGFIAVIWGILLFDLWPTLFGAMMVYFAKLWFLDRMVWLWQDMQNRNEEYRQ